MRNRDTERTGVLRQRLMALETDLDTLDEAPDQTRAQILRRPPPAPNPRTPRENQEAIRSA